MKRATEFAAAESRYFESLGLTVRTRYVDLPTPALRARVLEAGEGSPVLYLHGGGGCSAFWAPLLARVPGRAVCIDRPGCGLSDGFSYRGVDLRSHAVDFLVSALDALELSSVPIVATSMGALWALWLAVERPERVQSLALLGCPALILGTSGPFGFRLLSVRGLNRLMYAMDPPSEKQARRVFARMGHRADTVPREVAELFAALERLPTYLPGWLTLLETALRVGGGRFSFDEDELRRVRQPVVLVWGDRDAFGTPDVAGRAVAALPRAKLELVQGGHLPWLDDPDSCAMHVRRFLEPAAGRLAAGDETR